MGQVLGQSIFLSPRFVSVCVTTWKIFFFCVHVRECNTIPPLILILIMIHIVRWIVKNLLEKAANPEEIQGPNQLRLKADSL